MLQGGAFLARVSCSTPVVAPVLGVLGVGAASAMSGQASALFARWRRDGSAAFERKDWPRLVHVDDLALDALIGTALFMARTRLWDSAWHGRSMNHQQRLTLRL